MEKVEIKNTQECVSWASFTKFIYLLCSATNKKQQLAYAVLREAALTKGKYQRRPCSLAESF